MCVKVCALDSYLNFIDILKDYLYFEILRIWIKLKIYDINTILKQIFAWKSLFLKTELFRATSHESKQSTNKSLCFLNACLPKPNSLTPLLLHNTQVKLPLRCTLKRTVRVSHFPVDSHPILLMAGKPFNLNFAFVLKLFYHVESE